MVIRALKRHAQSFIAALQFLTRLPVPLSVPFGERTLARSVIYFPAAGAIIGVLTAGVVWLAGLLLPPLPAAVLALAVWIALSGGLHLDGWMDTADGVLSHRSRERMLEIMKDSRVGAMGVIAAVLLMLLKFAALAELIASGMGHDPLVSYILLAGLPAWSRWWMSAAIAFYPFARQGEGMAALFRAVKAKHAAASLAVAAALTAAFCLSAGLSFAQTASCLGGVLLLTVAAGIAGAAWLSRKLGGLTGDTYGALNEGIEALLLLAILVDVTN